MKITCKGFTFIIEVILRVLVGSGVSAKSEQMTGEIYKSVTYSWKSATQELPPPPRILYLIQMFK